MNDPIDQLKEWWDNAEVPTAHTLPREGDRIIFRYNSEWYEVATAADDAEECDLFAGMRILSRAPKPAWHNALAVLASCKYDAPDRGRGTFINDRSGQWLDEPGKRYVSDDLTDVTPLIKAEVTDEMVDRYWAAMKNPGSNYDEAVRRALASALGLEAE